jgi:hypothetical protein
MPLTKLRCEKWCGRGCTDAEYQRAKQLAAQMVKRLTQANVGNGWEPYVWENYGWFAKAMGCGGNLVVYAIGTNPRRKRRYHAQVGVLGTFGSCCDTPEEAARLAIALLKDRHAELKKAVRACCT